MYKINYKNVRKSRRAEMMAFKIGLFFVIIGLLFLSVMGFLMLGGAIKKGTMDSKVEAYNVIISNYESDEGNTLYSPTYYYIVDGIEYTYTPSSSTNIGIKDMENNKWIYYNSQDPNDCVSGFETKIRPIYIFCLVLISLFPIVGLSQIIKSCKRVKIVRERIKKMKWLAENGKLIRNLPYTLESTDMYVNHIPIMAIQVNYTLPSGSTIVLTGEPRFDRKSVDEDGFVDLLIDPMDPENFYIDFSIQQL